ncbi:MAG TPA: sugar phosphate isomerase/epimerase family protein [Abditibacterium sp.]
MFLTGIGDEAGAALEAQIAAHRALGWQQIELRAVQIEGFAGGNVHDIAEDAFEQVIRLLQSHDMQVVCFASMVANATKNLNNAEENSLETAKRAALRMRRLGTSLVRIMSFGVDVNDLQAEKRFQKLREICNIFSDNGITVAHENCCNYGGLGWNYSLQLLENVPGLKLLFDTGNPPRDLDYSPTAKGENVRQSSWEFYRQVKEHIVHVHIKDGVWNEQENRFQYVWPGEGQGDVAQILSDLNTSGYQGAISIEPHIMGHFRNGTMEGEGTSQMDAYIEYGRRLQSLIKTAASYSAEKR